MFEMQRFGLEGKIALVTGAARGIGRALTEAFAEAGTRALCLIDLEKETLNLTQKELTEKFPEVEFVAQCAGVFLCCQAEAKWMLAQGYGKIINIASMSGIAFVKCMYPGNLTACQYISHIVNHPQKHAAYHASKAGVLHLTRCLGAEWADRGVHVNCISPGYVDTYHTRRTEGILDEADSRSQIGTVEDLQGPAVFLASDASNFMYGAEIIADGGYSLW
eukprot:jgi/Galph1/3840/GphlegSOOS_G2507.1